MEVFIVITEFQQIIDVFDNLNAAKDCANHHKAQKILLGIVKKDFKPDNTIEETPQNVLPFKKREDKK
jgi:hypothetical protein